MQDNLQSSSYKELEQKSKYTNIFLRWFLYFVLILFASYFIFPLYVMVVTSLKTMEEIRQKTPIIRHCPMSKNGRFLLEFIGTENFHY